MTFQLTNIIKILLAACLFALACSRPDIGNGTAAFKAKDYPKALKNFIPLAQKGDPAAQYYLGLQYSNGYGVTKDPNAAFEWFHRSADQQYMESQYQLGVAFFTGIGAPEDFVQAYHWFARAAAQGNPKAPLFLKNLEERLTPDQMAIAKRLVEEHVPPRVQASDQGS